jgi:hypothetical protein
MCGRVHSSILHFLFISTHVLLHVQVAAADHPQPSSARLQKLSSLFILGFFLNHRGEVKMGRREY